MQGEVFNIPCNVTTVEEAFTQTMSTGIHCRNCQRLEEENQRLCNQLVDEKQKFLKHTLKEVGKDSDSTTVEELKTDSSSDKGREISFSSDIGTDDSNLYEEPSNQENQTETETDEDSDHGSRRYVALITCTLIILASFRGSTVPVL